MQIRDREFEVNKNKRKQWPIGEGTTSHPSFLTMRILLL